MIANIRNKIGQVIFKNNLSYKAPLVGLEQNSTNFLRYLKSYKIYNSNKHFNIPQKFEELTLEVTKNKPTKSVGFYLFNNYFL